MEGIEVKFEELLKKQGLTDEQVNAILSGMKENKIYTTSLENAEVRYNKLKDDKKDLETQLGKANTTIADLDKLKIDNEELKGKLTNYETEKANYEKALKDKDFNYALDKALTEYKCKDTELIKALIKKDNLKFEGDNVIGLKEQMEALQKERDYLFEKEIKGTGSFKTGGNPGGMSGLETNFAAELGKAKAQQFKDAGLSNFIK